MIDIAKLRDIIASRPELQRLAPTLVSLCDSHLEALTDIDGLTETNRQCRAEIARLREIVVRQADQIELLTVGVESEDD